MGCKKCQIQAFNLDDYKVDNFTSAIINRRGSPSIETFQTATARSYECVKTLGLKLSSGYRSRNYQKVLRAMFIHKMSILDTRKIEGNSYCTNEYNDLIKLMTEFGIQNSFAVAKTSAHSSGKGFDVQLPKDLKDRNDRIQEIENKCCLTRTYVDGGHWASCNSVRSITNEDFCANRTDWKNISCSDKNLYPLPNKTIQDLEKEARQKFCDEWQFCEPVFDLVKP